MDDESAMPSCKEHDQPVSLMPDGIVCLVWRLRGSFHKVALTAIASSVTNITSTGHEDAPHTDTVSVTVTVEGDCIFQYNLGSPC